MLSCIPWDSGSRKDGERKLEFVSKKWDFDNRPNFLLMCWSNGFWHFVPFLMYCRHGRFINKMSLSNPLKKLALCVILDLDGTLFNTGQLVLLASFIIWKSMLSYQSPCVLMCDIFHFHEPKLVKLIGRVRYLLNARILPFFFHRHKKVGNRNFQT